MSRLALSIAAAALAFGDLGCGDSKRQDGVASSAVEASARATSTAMAPSASQPTASTELRPMSPPSASAVASMTEGCPQGMLLVSGEYCPNVEQRCVEHHKEYQGDAQRKRAKAGEEGERSTVSERCLRYEAPSKCLSDKRKPMRFCIDRYEYPNEKGALPALLVSWVDAKKQCESQQKRLCKVEEFNFACEGSDMLPYTYGFVRDAQKCAIDKEYRKRKRKLLKYDKCMGNPACKEHLAELDQREPAGSRAECVSPFGVFDLNGNINEWVEIPGKKYPDRSGLKGGWWGPVRGRCRPTVGFHKEEDYGYEAGFRCCADESP